ncbi:MarR family transcriptional regulator [Thioclava sp. FTW29]|uniref:MarR family transcriptional regulator n=1 Tax=Thioclava litoralis TaxID=3076557 RepID=A0ABZ1E288_9RHOB|nr:MarR family transcriptional regulator [Thioclava sp. FTW29]
MADFDLPPENDDPPMIIGGHRIDILEGALSWYIRSLDSIVSRDLDKRMAHLEIAKGKGKITALLLVDDYPAIRPSEIAEVLMRDRPATGRILDRMVEQGLIRREPSPDDQRAQSLFITEKGHALSLEVREIIRTQEAEFFHMIPAPERQAFKRMLKSAYINMRKSWHD